VTEVLIAWIESMKNGLAEEGDLFLVVKDMPSGGLVTYAAPASGGFYCTVPAGTILITAQDQISGAPAFYCRPEKYEELEESLVPESERQDKYIGYTLVCKSAGIGDTLELIVSDEKN
jgi:hypothetical protein